MSGYDLPTSALIGGREYSIRSDFRVALDVISVMGDPNCDEEERTLVILGVFFVEFEEMPMADYQEAVNYVNWFLGGGDEPPKGKKPKLVDWEQDFQLIVAPINRVLSTDIRALDYFHWWSFLAAYREIGDCLFAQVVAIRKKRSRGEKLDKSDEKFYRENRQIIDFKHVEQDWETELLEEWT